MTVYCFSDLIFSYLVNITEMALFPHLGPWYYASISIREALILVSFFILLCYVSTYMTRIFRKGSETFKISQHFDLIILLFIIIALNRFLSRYLSCAFLELPPRHESELIRILVGLLDLFILMIYYARSLRIYIKYIIYYLLFLILLLLIFIIGAVLSYYHYFFWGMLLGIVTLLMIMETIGCITEEIIFTRTVYYTLFVKYNNIAALIITSTFFLALHDITSFKKVITVVSMSLLNCLLYYKYRKLIVPFLSHFCYNVFVMFIWI